MKDIASILWGCVREVKYSIDKQCCEMIEVLDDTRLDEVLDKINDEIVLLIYDEVYEQSCESYKR